MAVQLSREKLDRPPITSTCVWSICTTSSGRVTWYRPGVAVRARTKPVSPLRVARIRSSMRSSRALMVRQVGAGRPCCRQATAMCPTTRRSGGRVGFRYSRSRNCLISASLTGSSCKLPAGRPRRFSTRTSTVRVARYRTISWYSKERLMPSSQAASSTALFVMRPGYRLRRSRIACSLRQASVQARLSSEESSDIGD